MPALTRLTATAISAAIKRAADSGRPAVMKDPDQAGLELRVGSSGKCSWYLQCRDASGIPRRFMIGLYPGIGLSEARERCRTMREEVRRGADPVAAKRSRREAAKLAAGGGNSFARLLDVYERQHGRNLKSWAECRRRIECVFASFLKRDQGDLDLRELQRAADHWPSAQSAAAAVRYLRPILKWAAHPGRGYVARDLTLITPPATVGRRKRVLARDELARLLPVLRGSTSAYAAATQFMLLTACRRDEACSARWRDVDLQARQLRLPETKNGLEHVVPLSRQAIELVRTRWSDDAPPASLVFTSDGTKLMNWDRATKAFMAASETEGWHRHDLRRTAATIMGEMGIEPHVIEAALNHASVHSQLASTYNTARYRPQVADALQRLADALDRIATGDRVEVIPLRPGPMARLRRARGASAADGAASA